MREGKAPARFDILRRTRVEVGRSDVPRKLIKCRSFDLPTTTEELSSFFFCFVSYFGVLLLDARREEEVARTERLRGERGLLMNGISEVRRFCVV